MSSLSRIVISRANLLHNFHTLAALAPHAKVIAVVKANAYGHGLREVVGILDDVADYFQVDDIEELRILRGVSNKPVLVAGYVQMSDLREAVAYDATLLVYDVERLRALNEIGLTSGRRISIHFKIDALLGRQGVLLSQLPEYLILLQELSCIRVEAICTHFSNLEDTHDTRHAALQYAELVEAQRQFREAGFLEVSIHQAATSGVLGYSSAIKSDAFVRLGIGLYGVLPSERLSLPGLQLESVLQWVTKVAQVKILPAGFPVGYGCTYVTQGEMQIALIPQGYSDGFDRGLSNAGEVLIGGRCCRVLGRVAMNMFVVDVTGMAVSPEEEVVIIGTQGEGVITAGDIAEKIGSINYEVLARINPLLARIVH